MQKTSETVVFFGSGPVAAKCLAKLADSFTIEAVITKPKPEYHKDPFPVVELAHKLNLTTYTPKNGQELDRLLASHSVHSRLGIVIDYGIIISESAIGHFPLGIINSHFSLLPHLRGADPISFAILDGDSKTGVSLMLIVPELDAGPLLAQKDLPLNDEVTTPELTDQLIDLSHRLLIKTVPKYIAKEIKPYPQSHTNISYSRKLNKADSILDWQKPAIQLERQVRAFIEWPRSQCVVNGTRVVINKAHVITGKDQPGKLWIENKQLGVYTSDGIFVIDELIPTGKKLMTASAFLAGHPILH